MMVGVDLPQINDDERAHSARLAHLLIEKIRQNGFIPFSEYFAECLYHHELGYYTGALPKFGKEGDFVTAPIISPIFSYCLANQIAEFLTHCENGSIIEVGAGTGVMASDILTQLKKIDALPNYYCILEVSEDLKARQYQYLLDQHPDFIDRVLWLNEMPAKPWQGCIIGNEVVDALPIERFIIKNGEAYYADVTYDEENEQFITYSQRQDDVLLSFIQKLKSEGIQLADGYLSEFCPIVKSWLHDLVASLEKGAVLLIDYGYSQREYYMPERVEGTLIAHFKHRVHHDWSQFQGLQDLTANVDFTNLAEAGIEAGLEFLGYTTQAYFLTGNGLEDILLDIQKTASEIEWYKTAQMTQVLVMPTEMGERFKVLAMGKNVSIEPQGFALHDLSYQL